MYKEMKIEDGKIILKMDTWVRPFADGAIEGFAIAGNDRRFQPADASWLIKGKDQHNRPQYDRSTVVLSSPHVSNPIHFRYAWGRNPMGNLHSHDHNDLPFATQRSDDWRMENIPVDFSGFENLSPRDFARRAKGHFTQMHVTSSDNGRKKSQSVPGPKNWTPSWNKKSKPKPVIHAKPGECAAVLAPSWSFLSCFLVSFLID